MSASRKDHVKSAGTPHSKMHNNQPSSIYSQASKNSASNWSTQVERPASTVGLASLKPSKASTEKPQERNGKQPVQSNQRPRSQELQNSNTTGRSYHRSSKDPRPPKPLGSRQLLPHQEANQGPGSEERPRSPSGNSFFFPSPPPPNTPASSPLRPAAKPQPLSPQGQPRAGPGFELPVRTTYFRRAEESTTKPAMSDKDADLLCKKICDRVWATNLGKMWDRVVQADQRGNVDDRLYSQLLDFFYCFLPMVIKSPSSDPVIVSKRGLENYKRILNMFGDDQCWGQHISGTNDPHEWYSKPGNERFLEKISALWKKGKIFEKGPI